MSLTICRCNSVDSKVEVQRLEVHNWSICY